MNDSWKQAKLLHKNIAGRIRVSSAIVYTLLFNAALYQVISFTGGPHFPGPSESSEVIAPYFQEHPKAVMVCAFLQFGAAIDGAPTHLQVTGRA